MLLKIVKEFTESRIERNGRNVVRQVPTRIVHLKCDNCGLEFTRKYGRMLKSQREAKEHYCSDCPPWKTTFLRSSKMKCKELNERTIGQKKEISDGYISTYVGQGYPHKERVNQHGCILEHVRVLEEKLGHALNKKYNVHHIDGDKKNNHPDNLIALTRQEHSKCHASMWPLLFELVKSGMIHHNFETNEYEFTELGQTKLFSK